ncbi:hypothetical protein V6N12_028918 [Hibiscus sabdariffa]|uniref:Uncharacterized protein n=1 Tax=Hibiscus sabdariffa TaxID=183260 RepID=A0ABR2F787_9ROSI
MHGQNTWDEKQKIQRKSKGRGKRRVSRSSWYFCIVLIITIRSDNVAQPSFLGWLMCCLFLVRAGRIRPCDSASGCGFALPSGRRVWYWASRADWLKVVSGLLPIEYIILVVGREVKFFSVASLSRLVGGWHWLGGGGMLCSWCCFGLCIEVCGSDRELITKEIDKAGGGVGGGESGVKPKGESGVLSRLVGMAAGVGAGLVVWSETGDGPSSAGAGGAVAGTEGPASVVSAAGMWIGLVGGVDIATLRGMASAMFIFRIYQSGKGQDAFVIGASCCQFLCKNLTNIHAIARYNGVNEEQPCSIHRLVVRGGHDVSFNKCVPQLCLGPKAEAADRMWVSARCVPSCTLFTQKIFDLLKIFFFERIEHRVEAGVIIWQAQDGVDGGCVGCNSSATNGYVIVSSRVVGVELYYPVEICSGWLPCQAKPAEIIQPVVYDLL